MHHALEGGATLAGVLDAIAAARERVNLGLVAMVSVSIVSRVGEKAFVERAKAAGVDGFIFPDLPVEESGELLSAVEDAGLTASLLIAPTTPPERAERIALACTGFVYLIARTGITGERAEAPDIAGRVEMLRKATDLPIACGFGISKPEHVRAVVKHADAAIVGSALVKRIESAIERGEDAAEAAGAFVGELARGLG
jgi:tryptophan synthase alpha chain